MGHRVRHRVPIIQLIKLREMGKERVGGARQFRISKSFIRRFVGRVHWGED